MAAVTAAVVGGAAALGGAAISANATDKASQRAADAAEFRPFNVNMGGNGVSWSGNTATANMSPEFQAMQQFFQQQAMAGTPGMEHLMGAGAQSAGMMPGLAQDAYAGIDQGYGMQAGATDQYGLQMGAMSGQIPGMLGQFRSDAMAPGRADASSQFAINQGMGMLGQDPNAVIGDTLSRLRAQARPMEERAVNSRVNQLFNRGILSGTSGARSLGELALSQENADISRQQLAENAGLSRFQAQNNAGQGMLQIGHSGLFQGQQGNQNFANLGANYGFQGLQNNMTMANNMFGANSQLGTAFQNRGMNRVGLAQNMFGFGQSALGTDQTRQINAGNANLAMNADQRALVALGGNIGGQQAAAGATQASHIMANAGSPVGGFLSGAGTSMFNQSMQGLLKPPAPPPQLPPTSTGAYGGYAGWAEQGAAAGVT